MTDINIEYRPKEGYKKHYETDGQYKSDSIDINYNSNPTEDDRLGNLKDDLKTINNLIGGLQKPLNTIISVPVSGIQYVVNSFGPNLEEDNKAGMIITIPDDIYKNNNGDLEPESINDDIITEVDLFPNLPDVEINVIDGDGPEEKIRKQFEKDLVDIFEDFNAKLKNVLSNYYTGLLKAAKDCGIDDFKKLTKPLSCDLSKIKNRFIADSIIKSQIMRDQKQRLISKFFDTDEMITTIRRCKIAEQLKIRYYKAEYEYESSFLKTNKNTILSNQRMEYDKKYKENLYGLYKCLNSSVILLDECLQQSLTESQGKAILFKEEGIKL